MRIELCNTLGCHNTFIVNMFVHYRSWMIIKGRIIAILLVVIMVVSILGITVPNYFSVSNQFFSIEVVSQNNTPLQNVSVQGDIIAPISSHTGWNTIFSGITSSSGKFSTSNLTSLMKIGEEWKYALGPLITGSSPTITLFLTYSDNRGIYFKESSIYGAAQSGLVSDLLSGKSFSKTVVFNISGKPNFPAQNSSQPSISIPDNSTPQPSEPYGYLWEEVKCYNTGTIHIPVSWVSVSGAAYGEVNSLIDSTSSVKWNIGLDLGTGSSGISVSTGFQTGGTVWQNANVFLKSWTTGNPPTDGYVYIDAQAAGALFQLYKYNPYMCARFGLDSPHPTDDFQYDASIINPEVSSTGAICGGASSGTPPDISQISKNFSESYFGFYIGHGSQSNSPAQEIYSNSFVDDYASSDTQWISVGISVGAILEWALGPEATIPTYLLLSVVGSISSSSTDLSLGALSFDAPTGASVYIYVYVGNVNYEMTNGETGRIPLMGGCVIGIYQGL